VAYPIQDLVLHGQGAWTFARCACGHGLIAPMPDEAELAAFYSQLYTPENLERMKQANESGFDKALRAARIAAVKAALDSTEPARLLDVGCGLGHFLTELAEALGAADATGVEFGGPAADAAEERLTTALGAPDSPRVLRELFDEVSLDEPVDVVSMNHFLEHHPRPERALAHAVGLVRDGGLVEVEVPRGDGWGIRLLGRWWWPHLPPQHVHMFSRKGLERALRTAGLEPVSWRVSGYPMTLSASWVHRIQHTLGRRSRFAGNPLMAGLSWLLGAPGLLLTALFDLTAGALLNRTSGDILMVVARKVTAPSPPP
jgi:ubiquinone/menaquinone biosynthesis C-methylase UbiE